MLVDGELRGECMARRAHEDSSGVLLVDLSEKTNESVLDIIKVEFLAAVFVFAF